MILDAKVNNFVVLFPMNFWDESLVKRYEDYYRYSQLPYENIGDFVFSTVQSISFPDLKIKTAQQTRKYGKKADYKGSDPVEDTLTRQFTISFKLGEGMLNYRFMHENIIHYLDHNNETQYFDDIVLGVLDNDGYLMETTKFKQVIITGISSVQYSYTGIDGGFNKFDVSFNFNDWVVTTYYDKMINLVQGY